MFASHYFSVSHRRPIFSPYTNTFPPSPSCSPLPCSPSFLSSLPHIYSISSHIAFSFWFPFPKPHCLRPILNPARHQMRFATSFTRLCTAASILSLASSVFALPRVTRAGRYLYSEDGTRFYIKGVAYQEQGILFSFIYLLLGAWRLIPNSLSR